MAVLQGGGGGARLGRNRRGPQVVVFFLPTLNLYLIVVILINYGPINLYSLFFPSLQIHLDNELHGHLSLHHHRYTLHQSVCFN